MADDAVARVREFVRVSRLAPDTFGQGVAGALDENGAMHRLTEDDLDALLAELEQSRAELAEAARAVGGFLARATHAEARLRAALADRRGADAPPHG